MKVEQNVQCSDHVQSQTQPKQPSVRHSMLHSGVVPEELQGIVTVHYGLQRTTMRKIFMKVRSLLLDGCRNDSDHLIIFKFVSFTEEGFWPKYV